MKRKIDLDVSMRWSDAVPEQLENKTVIVIDVLRCTSVMIAALGNGCERIVPVLEPARAESLADELDREHCILGGERGCNKLPGFDVGNSPLEYTQSKVGGKTVIITTSNGTNAVRRAAAGKLILIGALSNRSACAKADVEAGRDIHIICSGTSGRVSADDLIAAGGIIRAVCDYSAKQDISIHQSDSSLVCRVMYDSFLKNEFDLVGSYHCSRLISLGYRADIEYCVTEDTSEVVPYFNGEDIRIYRK